MAKYDIYCQRMHNENGIALYQYQNRIEKQIKTEHFIYTLNSTICKIENCQFLYEHL